MWQAEMTADGSCGVPPPGAQSGSRAGCGTAEALSAWDSSPMSPGAATGLRDPRTIGSLDLPFHTRSFQDNRSGAAHSPGPQAPVRPRKAGLREAKLGDQPFTLPMCYFDPTYCLF